MQESVFYIRRRNQSQSPLTVVWERRSGHKFSHSVPPGATEHSRRAHCNECAVAMERTRGWAPFDHGQTLHHRGTLVALSPLWHSGGTLMVALSSPERVIDGVNDGRQWSLLPRWRPLMTMVALSGAATVNARWRRRLSGDSPSAPIPLEPDDSQWAPWPSRVNINGRDAH